MANDLGHIVDRLPKHIAHDRIHIRPFKTQDGITQAPRDPAALADRFLEVVQQPARQIDDAPGRRVFIGLGRHRQIAHAKHIGHDDVDLVLFVGGFGLVQNRDCKGRQSAQGKLTSQFLATLVRPRDVGAEQLAQPFIDAKTTLGLDHVAQAGQDDPGNDFLQKIISRDPKSLAEQLLWAEEPVRLAAVIHDHQVSCAAAYIDACDPQRCFGLAARSGGTGPAAKRQVALDLSVELLRDLGVKVD